jgi:PII-like signaling protein
VNRECLKLTVYFGERDRADGTFLADALLDRFERHRFQVSVVLRGVEGFGMKHRLHSDRLLTLSEDLPIVAVAVDERKRIEQAVPEFEELIGDGLITLERAQLLQGNAGPEDLPSDIAAETKLTVYAGRQARVGDRPAHIALVGALHRMGIDGATVLLGVDGTLAGRRQRARFFSRNAEVPLMVISVGAGQRIAAALPELRRMLPDATMTLERVRVLKRDGERSSELPEVESTDPGKHLWLKLMLHANERARAGRRPLYIEAIRRLREEEAAGATALRGIWGYDGENGPHGDTFWSLRRRVPVLTVIVDTPERTRRWASVLDELTPERGLLTCEIVPAFQASHETGTHGGLGLAKPWRG